MTMTTRLIMPLLAMAALATQPSVAQTPTGAEAAPATLPPFAEEFLVGNIAFIVFHEFGHAIIREFNVPLLGLEEDAADTIAAVTLLSQDHDDPSDKVSLTELLAMAAVGNLLTWKTGLEKGNTEMAVWSQHSLSVKRFARIICLLYGSDTPRYQWIADMAKMPDIRSDWCEDELAVARHGVDWLVKTYGAKAGTGGAKPHGRISVVFEKPRSADQERALGFLKKRHVLEKAAAIVDTEFDFPQPFSVRVKDCSGPNAYWDPDARELLFCYDLLETLAKVSSKPEIAAVGRAFDEQSR